jgi:threonine dehydratase
LTEASIYLPAGASRVRADRIEACGGQIIWRSGTYDDAVVEAVAATRRGDGILVPDTSSDVRATPNCGWNISSIPTAPFCWWLLRVP